MAKRQRGGARPGQRAPLQRSGRSAAPAPASGTASPTRPAGGLSDDELARAAQLEAQIVAEEQAASSALSRGRDRRRSAPGPGAAVPRTRSAGLLTATAEDEYRYVMADLRKIAAVFALVFGLLVVSWLLIVVSGVVEV